MTYASHNTRWHDPTMGLKTRRHPVGIKSVSSFNQKQSSYLKNDTFSRANTTLSSSIKRTPLKADHSVKPIYKEPQYERPKPRLNREKSRSLSNICSKESSTLRDKGLSKKENESRSNLYNDINPIKRSEILMNSAKLKLEKLNIDFYQKKISNVFKKEPVVVRSPVPRPVRSNSFSNSSNTYEPRVCRSEASPLPGISKARRHSLESIKSVEKSESPSSQVVCDEKKSYMSSRTEVSSAGRSRYSQSGVCGLRNLGNTCFMNSILQCLSKDKTLRSYFCTNQYRKDVTHKSRLASAFGDLLNDMWKLKENGVLSPTLLKMEIQRFASRFAGTHQHDSQEFLRCLIEGVHDELNAIKTKPTYSYDDIDHIKDDMEKGAIVWDRYLSRERSIIQDLFVGQLRSTLTCSICKYASVTFDPFWDLSLPIPSKSTTSQVSINECFNIFTQEEILDGGEKPTCEKCKKRTKCTKKFLIERCPNVLVLHLKRFSGVRYRTKLTTNVSFPMELNIQEYTVSNEKCNYRLFGVSNHVGSTQGGHYTAYCKHPDTSKWHLYNDARVTEVSSKDVITPAAYVLFYELIK